MKHLNPKRMMEVLPDLDRVEAVARDGVLAGCPLRLSWDGWETRDGPRGLQGRDFTRDDITLDSDIGQIVLERPLVRRIWSDGRISGSAISTRLSRLAHDQPLVFRTLVKTDADFWMRVCLPDQFRDSISGASCPLLPIRACGVEIDVYYMKDGPFVVFEMRAAPGESKQIEDFRSICGSTRQLLMYLTGECLDAPSCELLVTDGTDQFIEATWRPGRSRERHHYHPVPSSWAEWSAAKHALGVQGPLRSALGTGAVSSCLEKLATRPALVAPLEYLIRFPSAPIEMRGAFISVALESVTDEIQKVGLLRELSVLPENAWAELKKEMEAVIGSHGKGWDDQQKRTLLARIENLNRPSNAQKLLEPFQALKVTITKDEREAIERRNKLLHSGRLLAPETAKTDPHAWRGAYLTEMRFYTAVNKLLLKYLGYTGVVIDWGETSIETGDQKYLAL